MSEDYGDDDIDIEDDYEDENEDYNEDINEEENINNGDDLDLIEDTDTNMFDISQFYNKNEYETISKLENELASTKKKSKNKITKYEYTKVIGIRAQELANGSPPFIDVTGMHEVIDIAEEEFKQDKIPYILRRPMPNGEYEYFRLNELRKK